MGQKKRDRTTTWRDEQIDAEMRQRTEKVIADYKARLKAEVVVKAEEIKKEETNETENDQFVYYIVYLFWMWS